MAKSKTAGMVVAIWSLLAMLGMAGFWPTQPAQAAVTADVWQLDQPVVSHADELSANVKELWQVPLGFSRHYPDTVAAIWPLGRAVYVITIRGFLISVDAHSGTINWDAKPARFGQTISRPLPYAKGQIMILADGLVKIINVADGHLVKAMKLRVAPGSNPILFNGRLLVGGAYRGFYGLSASFPNTVRWAQYSKNDSFVSDPVLTKNGAVTFASTHGDVWNKDATSGNGTWKRILGAGVTAALSTNNKLVFVPCRNDNLYAFNVLNGRSPWILHLPGKLNSPAVPVDGQVLIISSTAGLYGISIATGLKTWGPVAGVRQLAAIAGHRVFAVGAQGNLRILSVKSGRELAKIHIPDARFCASNISGATVYLVTSHGELTAVAMRRSN